MMMEWGTRRADELNLECFVEASTQGYQLYSRHGFRAQRVAEITPSPELDEDNDEWRSCRKLTAGLNCCVMNRPVKGEWPESKHFIRPRGSLITNLWEKGDQL